LLGELASWGVAAAILVTAAAHYDTLRRVTAETLGLDQGGGATAETSASDAKESAGPKRSGAEELNSGPDGHYHADAEINGRAISVLVDTGATMVALTYEDAERAGFRLRSSDFTQRVSTANGFAAVAPVTLERVSIGHITVRNVRAAVAERGRLEKTLLGMSFLSRLDRVDISNGRLLLVE
jgi:aspartyl protease family protein